MDAEQLMKRIIAYGADKEGIADRFLNNNELYLICFNEFIIEPNFDILDEALRREECNTAFNAAHAIKGICGNLGLTDFYLCTCELVESLRAHEPEKAKILYKKFLDEKLRVFALSNPDDDDINLSETPQQIKYNHD